MKLSVILVCLLVGVTGTLSGQEQTLLGEGDIEHGGYGAFVVRMSTINGEPGLLVGGRGGWIINHVVSIGFGGYGLANDVRALVEGPFGQRFVQFGYGGLDLEFVFNSDDLIHISAHTLFGAGAAGFRYGMFEDSDWDNDFFGMSGDMFHERDQFFVIEPGVTVDLNVAKWFRLSAGASYRYVSGLNTRSTSGAQSSTPSGMVMFRFGLF